MWRPLIDTSNYPGEGVPQNTPDNERRKSKRYDCDGFAEIVGTHIGFLFRGEIQNLSQTGCYIRTRAQLKLELYTEVQLHFAVDGANYHTGARIMVVKPQLGAGFEFLTEDDKLKGDIAKLLEKLEAKHDAKFAAKLNVKH